MRNGLFGGGSLSGGHLSPLRGLVAVCVLGLLSAGCAGGLGGGGNEGPMGAGNSDGQGAFGSTMETTTVAPTSGSGTTARSVPNTAPPLPAPVTAGAAGPVQTVVAGNANASAAGSAPVADASDYTCPGVQVRSGAAAWQVTDKADGGIRYQANLGTFSRECHFTRPTMNMRVGIQGRVLLGAKGGPGKVSVPIRLAVVEEGPTPKPVWTQFYSVPVEIGPGVMQVDFGLVADDVNFPLPTPDKLERYVIYVGFDSQAGEGESRRAPRQQPRPAQAARPKPVAPAAQATPASSPAPAQTSRPAPAPAPAPAAAAASTPAVSAPAATPAASAAPAAAPAKPATSSVVPPSGNQQWIGSPAPAAGGFSQ